MATSVLSKTLDIFTQGIAITTQIEDKATTFAKKSFTSIKEIKLQDLKHVPSKIFKFVKENKFNLALATLSLATSAIVFVKVSAIAAFLFLGAYIFC